MASAADDATPFTRAEARAVLGPLLLVALKAATVTGAATGGDDAERTRIWNEFSAAATGLIDTMRKLDLLDEDHGVDGR